MTLSKLGVRYFYSRLPKEITSEYIDTGSSLEEIIFSRIRIDLEHECVQSFVDVRTDFENSYEGDKDNSWHWSVITAYRAISQLAIAYICLELDKTKNEIGEIMQISSSITTKEPIKEKTNVPMYINFSKYIKRGNRLLGQLDFDVKGKSFYGNIRFAVDLPHQQKTF
ncbi:hypothetical protein KY348_02800 [Candidatus Woesearchaeota archaeon]|nr:hypothetical protein [Candidatus Woesearchaeota archaeon]